MTDEHRRIQRMNYLVSRIWPQQEQASIETSLHHCSVVGVYGRLLLQVPRHPNGLDALEAALCAMGREMPSWLLVTVEEWERRGLREGNETLVACAEEMRRSVWQRS